MVGFGWKTCSQMFVRVWNHIIGAHKKPEALFFFFSPLLSSSGSVCKALKKPELPFEKWCFIFISETSFGLDLHLNFWKPDLLKSLYKSEMAVSTYIHMYRKGLVFPSPSKPRVLSRVMYHRYNIQATTRALVRQRSLSSFSKSHDSVKVILPMIIHISRGLRHAGYSDRHRRRTSVRVKTTTNVEKVHCMYRAHST